MAEPSDPNKKKKPPSTSDILKKIRQKKQIDSKGKPKATKKSQEKKSDSKKPLQSITQPNKASSKKSVKKKIAITEPEAIEKPIAELDKEETPSFLSEKVDEVHESVSNEIGEQESKPEKKIRKRFVSAKVIPKINYQRMKDLIFKRGFFHIIILFWLTVICGVAIVWVVKEFERRSLILRGVDKGFIALEENKPDQASLYFLETLQRYATFRVGFSKNLWFIDGQIELAVMRMALGYSRLGEFEKGIQCFKQVCLHDPFSIQPWLSGRLTQHITEFAYPGYWEEDEMQRMYWYTMKSNPSSWGVGEFYLPLLTEYVGMNVYPLSERFEEAYDVVYGKPLQRNAGNTFSVQAEIFYKQIVPSGKLDIALPINLSEEAEKRLDWYISKEMNCVFFCRETSGAYVLDGIQGIQMNSPYFMEEFENIVDTYDYSNS